MYLWMYFCLYRFIFSDCAYFKAKVCINSRKSFAHSAQFIKWGRNGPLTTDQSMDGGSCCCVGSTESVDVALPLNWNDKVAVILILDVEHRRVEHRALDSLINT